MIKKLFLLVYMGIGIVTLFQISKLIDTVIERRLLSYSVDTEIKSSKDGSIPDIDRLTYDSSIALSPLFTAFEGSAQVFPTEESSVADSPLLRRYELNGVILLSRDRSIALIRKTGERESGVYRRGDRVENSEIVKIERYRVFLKEGARTVILPMYYKYTSVPAQRTQSSPMSGRDREPVGSQEIRKVLSRSDVENRVFKKVNQILTQIAISPYMVNGQMEGLRLIRVPQNSIVYELGGRSGDIIRRVNGHEVNQIDQMYKLWENIKDDSMINVDLERKNQMHTYTFEIRE